MGQSTNALLMYGYDLGGAEEWKLAEAKEGPSNEYGSLKTAWFDGDAEELNEDQSVVDLMYRVLYEAMPQHPEVEYDFQREEPVKEHYGVWFASHCSADYPMWCLVAYELTAYRGFPELLDMAALAREAADCGWDGKLQRALDVLGITPDQRSAGWILASDWN